MACLAQHLPPGQDRPSPWEAVDALATDVLRVCHCSSGGIASRAAEIARGAEITAAQGPSRDLDFQRFSLLYVALLNFCALPANVSLPGDAEDIFAFFAPEDRPTLRELFSRLRLLCGPTVGCGQWIRAWQAELRPNPSYPGSCYADAGAQEAARAAIEAFSPPAGIVFMELDAIGSAVLERSGYVLARRVAPPAGGPAARGGTLARGNAGVLGASSPVPGLLPRANGANWVRRGAREELDSSDAPQATGAQVSPPDARSEWQQSPQRSEQARAVPPLGSSAGFSGPAAERPVSERGVAAAAVEPTQQPCSCEVPPPPWNGCWPRCAPPCCGSRCAGFVRCPIRLCCSGQCQQWCEHGHGSYGESTPFFWA